MSRLLGRMTWKIIHRGITLQLSIRVMLMMLIRMMTIEDDDDDQDDSDDDINEKGHSMQRGASSYVP